LCTRTVGSKYAANTDHAFLKLPDRALGIYNSHDSYWTARLLKPLFHELERRHQLKYFTDWVEPLQLAVLDMQSRGLLLDRRALNQYRKEVRNELRETDSQILAADPTGDLSKPTAKYPNGIGSPKRLGAFLFEVLGLKPPKKTDTGLDSTDQETLYRLLRDLRKKDVGQRPILEALFHRSRLKTISQRYLDLEADHDGRVRARVKMYGTKTFRFAYAEPALQQFPKEIRHLFVSSNRHVFLSVDFSQLEARILAILAGDRQALGVFQKEGGDVHRSNAQDLFGCEARAVTEGHRNFAKAFLYGISYGGHAETMKTKLYCPCPKCRDSVPPTLELKKAEIQRASDRRYDQHPAVTQFHRDLTRGVRDNHYWESPLGARRYLAKPWGHDLEREVKNLPMQFTAALLMNRAQVRLHKVKAPIILQHHDSFLLECLENKVEKWAHRAKAVMEAPVPELGGVSFPISVEVGPSWGQMTKWQGA